MEDNLQYPGRFEFDPAMFYDAVAKSTDDYIYIIDMRTDIALVSENMQKEFALPERLIKGLVPKWGELIHERDKERYFTSIDQMMSGETQEHNEEYQIRNRKDEYIWVRCRGRLQRDESGDPVMFAGVVTNLSSRGKVDSVTGLFMQKECERALEVILEQKKFPAGILILGLDDFSGINNLKGHDFGDAVLRQFAQDVMRLLPAKTAIYRFDGDEFVIVCRRSSAEEIYEIFRQISEYGHKNHALEEGTYYCTVSGGIAMVGEDGENYRELLKCASAALDEAKKKGKDGCTIYRCGLIHSKIRSLTLLEKLRDSVMNGMTGFSVVYQPILHIYNKKVSGAEALLRWSDQELGAVSPVEFIPLLENSGLILPVGKWVLEQAVCRCKAWLDREPDFIMNVNCSYLQFQDATFLPFVEQVLDKYQVEAKHIVLEMTESRFVTDKEDLKNSFDRLRKNNIRLAMDDFGTGYSSLGMLSSSPADIVKIDRAFISGINDAEHAFNRSFIGAVIELCHSVGIHVCVEGVEEPEELDAVVSLDADCIQGFHIERPIPPEKFEEKFLTGKMWTNADTIKNK